jgi:hypothetical protein
MIKVPPSEIARYHRQKLEQLQALEKKIEELYAQRKKLVNELSIAAEAFKRLRDSDPRLDLPQLEFPPEIIANPRYSATIGDAIEAVLKRHGPLRRKEILKNLQESGVRISQKNAFIVVSNAVKRDPKNRFNVLMNRKVALRNAKADAKR